MGLYFNNDVIGIIETDASRRIVRANPTACRMLGYTSDELMQRTWEDVTHPDDVQRAIDHFEPAFDRAVSATALQLRCLTKSGEELNVALNIQAGDRGPENRPLFYVGFVLDISGQRQAERRVAENERRINDLHNKISRALSDTLGSRDPYTANHQNSVSRLSNCICERLGLPLTERRTVVAAAAVHDIGKAGIPSEYLTKTTKLDDLEWAVVRTHALRGYEILKPMDTEFPVAEIVYQHHERLDGSGYPRALKNGAILREAQIISAADMADSIMNARPYRGALGKDIALAALTDTREKGIDKDVVDACIAVLSEAAPTGE